VLNLAENLKKCGNQAITVFPDGSGFFLNQHGCKKFSSPAQAAKLATDHAT
jgi:hypothetical protein